MVVEVIAAEFAHVIFGMMWVGTSIYIELILAPILRKAKTAGEFRQLLAILGKTSSFQGMSAILVILTGVAYLLLVYDLGSILTSTPGQLVIVSLILVLVAIVNGFAFLRPVAIKIVRSAWPDDPNAPVPDSVKALERKLLAGSLMSTGIVIVVLLLMVTAAVL